MSSWCNCGKTFSRQQGEKSYSRKSLESTAVVSRVNTTLGALVVEFNVTLTPEKKDNGFCEQNVHGLLFPWQN